jgi:SAM-dependent methyltransferase
MTTDIFVFDRKSVRIKRKRAAPHLADHGFLFDWALKQLTHRLEDIKREFPTALQIGLRSQNTLKNRYGIETLYTLDSAPALSPNILAEEDLLPFGGNSFDLIYSALNLHTVNDLPGALAQMKHCLKPDGLFIAAMMGGETLYELRSILQQAELETLSGLSPRVAPFADMPQMGNLMQRAGFNLPVIDSEKVTVTYDNIFKLMKDLRLMGENNSLKARYNKFTPRSFFARADELYKQYFSEENGKITATFDVIFLIGWAPHESQQKPLRPGSAKTRLADALQTTEGKLPC